METYSLLTLFQPVRENKTKAIRTAVFNFIYVMEIFLYELFASFFLIDFVDSKKTEVAFV